jgi:Flp pilus assembly protein TadG
VIGIGKRLRHERGAAAVEFAIISSALFMLVFGIIEFGQAYSQYEVFQGAAREGARMAAVRSPEQDVVDRVYQAAKPYQPTSRPNQDRVCDEDTLGQPVTVSWTQHFKIVVPFLPAIDKDVVIKGVFRCE